MFSVTLFNLQGTRRFAAVIALAERLDYLTTSRFACQELFQVFSNFFRAPSKLYSLEVFRGSHSVSVLCRSVERLLILSEPFPFVNTFFRLF